MSGDLAEMLETLRGHYLRCSEGAKVRHARAEEAGNLSWALSEATRTAIYANVAEDLANLLEAVAS